VVGVADTSRQGGGGSPACRLVEFRIGSGKRKGEQAMPRTKKEVSRKAKPKRRRTVFRVTAPEAHEVFLAGDFNDWDVRKHPMKKEKNGVWKKVTQLLPGRHEYKFLIDGQWHNDPASGWTCQNAFGTTNNVIEVEADQKRVHS
jgi:1,4-alpha-glucan branching enzyme